MTATILLIGSVAIISSIFGELGWRKTERTLDGACIAVALVWMAAMGPTQPCMLADPDHQHPWDRSGAHAIDWRTR